MMKEFRSIEELPVWELKLTYNDFQYLYTLERKQNKMSKTRYDLYGYNPFNTFSGPVLAFEYGEQ